MNATRDRVFKHHKRCLCCGKFPGEVCKNHGHWTPLSMYDRICPSCHTRNDGLGRIYRANPGREVLLG